VLKRLPFKRLFPGGGGGVNVFKRIITAILLNNFLSHYYHLSPILAGKDYFKKGFY
jgi:hypothetical protein